jgi:hypothetical protein
MTFCDDSDFAPLVPMRDGNHVTEMEEIARGEEFIQAGVCLFSYFSELGLINRNWKWELRRLHSVKRSTVCLLSPPEDIRS